MWKMLWDLVPGWKVLFQGFVIFIVPVVLTRLMIWLRMKEGKASTRGMRAEGKKAGVPSSEDTGEADQTSIAVQNKNPLHPHPCSKQRFTGHSFPDLYRRVPT